MHWVELSTGLWSAKVTYRVIHASKYGLHLALDWTDLCVKHCTRPLLALLLHGGLLPQQLLQPAVLPVDVNVQLLP
jgi:hypothetical protein